MRLGLLKLLQFDIDRGETGGRQVGALLEAIALTAQIIDLGLAGDRLILQMGVTAHLFEMASLIGGDLLVQLAEPRHGGLQMRFELLHLLAIVVGLARRLLQRCFGRSGRLGEGADAHRQLRQALTRLGQLRFEVAGQSAFMRDRRFFRLDLLQPLRQQPLFLVQMIVEVGEEHLEPFRFRFAGAGAGGPLVQFALELLQRQRLGVELLGEFAVLLQAEAEAKFFQAIAVFLVALGLGRLQFDAAELLLDLLNDVLDAGQI